MSGLAVTRNLILRGSTLSCQRGIALAHRYRGCFHRGASATNPFTAATTLRSKPSPNKLGQEIQYKEHYSCGPALLSSLKDATQHAKDGSISSEQLLKMAEEAKSIILQLSTLSDPPPRAINIEFMAYMVAAYRILKHQIDMPVPQIRRFLDDAIQRTMRPASDHVRSNLDSSHDPFSLMVDQSKSREENFFISPDFKLERVRDEPGSYQVKVHQCWYMDTLRRLDASEIGPSFCSFDNLWSDRIDTERHGFKFTRPTTIAEGDNSCAFNLDRVSAPPDMEEDLKKS